MTAWELRVAERVFDIVAPPMDGVPRPSELSLRPFVRDFLALQPWAARLGLRVFLMLFAYAPLLVIGRAAPVWRLSPADQDRYTSAWLHSPVYFVRLLSMVLKSWVFFLWGGEPSVQERLGCKQPGQRPSVDGASLRRGQ